MSSRFCGVLIAMTQFVFPVQKSRAARLERHACWFQKKLEGIVPRGVDKTRWDPPNRNVHPIGQWTHGGLGRLPLPERAGNFAAGNFHAFGSLEVTRPHHHAVFARLVPGRGHVEDHGIILPPDECGGEAHFADGIAMPGLRRAHEIAEGYVILERLDVQARPPSPRAGKSGRPRCLFAGRPPCCNSAARAPLRSTPCCACSRA